MNIIETIQDEKLFAPHFGGDSWQYWQALLAGFYGLKMTPKQRKQFEQLTKRSATGKEFKELWLVMGRRSGKSNTSALLAVYEAFFNDYTDKLAAGEVATVFVIAADRKQARSVMRYIRGMIDANPLLQSMVVKDSQESIELSNRTVIEIMTAGFKGIRGYSVGCAILDECAFWSDQGANPDKEILAALKPSLATLDGKIIALSSPYSKKGVLYNAWKRYFGKEQSERVLVAQAPSRLMNPMLPEHVVQQALEEDPASARSEYLAEFRDDISSFISRDVVDTLIATGRRELPYLSENRYFAFVDPSGGSKDAMTLSIAHKEDKTVVLDVIRAIKPPFSPEQVVDDFCTLLTEYKIKSVTGDRYGGEFCREPFFKRGIRYEPSKKSKSELYRDMLPLLNSGLVEFLDHEQMINELVGLERRTARGGRDSIDHAPNGTDDSINAVAGVINLVKKPAPQFVFAC